MWYYKFLAALHYPYGSVWFVTSVGSTVLARPNRLYRGARKVCPRHFLRLQNRNTDTENTGMAASFHDMSRVSDIYPLLRMEHILIH